MATLISAQHVFMFLWIIGSVAAGVLEKEPGENVTLPCHSHTGANVTKLVWSRPDLENGDVFFFRDGSPSENYQDPRYHGRVELKDPQMKNGDASVVLKNVNVNDTGTYECRVTTPNRPKELLGSVQLSVKGPPKASSPFPGWAVALLVVFLVVVVGVAGFALRPFVFSKISKWSFVESR